MKSCSCAGVAILNLAPNYDVPEKRDVLLPHVSAYAGAFLVRGGDRFSFRATAAMMSPGYLRGQREGALWDDWQC